MPIYTDPVVVRCKDNLAIESSDPTCPFVSHYSDLPERSNVSERQGKRFRASEIGPRAARNTEPSGEAELGQDGLTVFCIRHRRLLAGRRFSVSADRSSSAPHRRRSDTLGEVYDERSSSRCLRSSARRVSDLRDLREIRERLPRTQAESAIRDQEDRLALRRASAAVAVRIRIANETT